MNCAAASYTPLECLLLFQSLVTYGTDDKSFAQISDLLTNNIFIKDGNSYDATRLKSNALRDLYLNLLRDELKAEEDGLESGNQSGSRKRKIPSPTLSTVKDAEGHKDKLPAFVDRLYARYRKSMVDAITEDERRYAILQQEAEQIERGEWDEHIRKENTAVMNGSASVTPKQARAKVNGTSTGPETAIELPVPRLMDEQSTPKVDGVIANDGIKTHESSKPSSPRTTDSKPQPTLQHVPPLQRRLSSNGLHGLSPLQPSTQPFHAPQPGQVPPQHPGMAYKWETPMYGLPQPYPNGVSHPPQYPQHYPPQAYPPQYRGPFSGQGLQHPHVPSSPLKAHHPNSMAPLPPAGSHRSPGSPHGMPLDALADTAGQQYRATSGSPLLQPPQMQGGPMHPPPGNYPPYPQARPHTASQWNNPAYVPPYPNSPAPQYAASPSQPQSQGPFTPLADSHPKSYSSPYNPSQGGQKQPVLSSMRQSMSGTPQSHGSNRFLSGNHTPWKQKPVGLGTEMITSVPDSPAWEPLSPVLPKSQPASTMKSSKKVVSKSEAKVNKPAPKRRNQRTRAGSTASSVIAGSYRSQSVASHTDELSRDSAVKEEVSTPLSLPFGVDEETGDTTADESLPNTRSRPSNIIASPRLKRKRTESVILTPREPPGPATSVLWTRAFPRISASALEAINGHKSATTFALPVKERDAPGYNTCIFRPQDLKSIKSMITAGHRAAAAVAPEDIPSTQSRVWLLISEDLVPPRGIINYAQLEKELMRMFANAIMFNADPDRGLGASWDEMLGHGKSGGGGYEIDENSVVKETKAMYADVEKIVEELMGAERKNEEMMAIGRGDSVMRESSAIHGDDDVDELAAEADTGTMSKRRRKG